MYGEALANANSVDKQRQYIPMLKIGVANVKQMAANQVEAMHKNLVATFPMPSKVWTTLSNKANAFV